MSTPETLRLSRTSYASQLRGILREFSNNQNIYFALVEGKDTNYYRPRVGSILPDAYISFRNCRGKKKLKQLHQALLRNEYILPLRYMVFYDRDYEHDINELQLPRTYITDGYSIENYYTSNTALKAIVSGIFYSDAIEDEDEAESLNDIAGRFEKFQSSCHALLELFNKWAWAQRHLRKDGSIDLNRFDVYSQLKFEFDKEKYDSDYDLSLLNSLAPERDPVTSVDLLLAEKWFSGRSAQLSFRGKQEIDLLNKFLDHLVKQAEKSASPFSRKYKCRNRLSRAEAISDLSAFADTPKSLISFLQAVRAEMGM